MLTACQVLGEEQVRLMALAEFGGDARGALDNYNTADEVSHRHSIPTCFHIILLLFRVLPMALHSHSTLAMRCTTDTLLPPLLVPSLNYPLEREIIIILTAPPSASRDNLLIRGFRGFSTKLLNGIPQLAGEDPHSPFTSSTPIPSRQMSA